MKAVSGAGGGGGDKVTFGETEVIRTNDESDPTGAEADTDAPASTAQPGTPEQTAAGAHLNLPAVLWDRQPGSKNKVPPPVPPRSPRKPMEASPAFEAALNKEAAAAVAAGASGSRPASAASTGAVAAVAPGPSRGWKTPNFVTRHLRCWLTLSLICSVIFSFCHNKKLCPSYDPVVTGSQAFCTLLDVASSKWWGQICKEKKNTFGTIATSQNFRLKV